MDSINFDIRSSKVLNRNKNAEKVARSQVVRERLQLPPETEPQINGIAWLEEPQGEMRFTQEVDCEEISAGSTSILNWLIV